MVEEAHKRPDLTIPEAEADFLCQHYEEADVILEYGLGISSVMASEMEGKHITSVESDKAWWQMMMEWFMLIQHQRGQPSTCFMPTSDQRENGVTPRTSVLGNSLHSIHWLCGRWISYAPQTLFWLMGVSVSDVLRPPHTTSNSLQFCCLTTIRHASGCTRPRTFLVNQKLWAAWPRLNLNRSRSQRDVCLKLLITCCAQDWVVRE